jgi:rRNA small subunit pseudouridine methyltransferase Nep1
MKSARPRRQSYSTHSPPKVAAVQGTGDDLEPPPPPRPKSTPIEEPPRQRRRQNPEPDSDASQSDGESNEDGEEVGPIEEEDRPTKPLPRKVLVLAQPKPQMANPSMLPVQAQVPKTGSNTGHRRLYVILEQACLESYRVTSGGKNKSGRGEDGVKYALLNCDDHQGILAKMGRDIADARPDITHQVRSVVLLCWMRLFILCSASSPSLTRP